MDTPPDAYREWDRLVAALQRYASRKYGQVAVGFSLHLQHGDQHREPLPLVAPADPPQRTRKGPADADAAQG